MLILLISIIGIFLTLILIIGIHEFGHFIAARLLGVKVLSFSIGFGKALWSRYDKKGTEYIISAIPLGGYVKMLDENESLVADNQLHLTFNRQPYYKKFIIVAAGPLSNLLLAFGLYWTLFMIGFTSIAPVIGHVTPNSIAANAGVKSQYEIISIDGRSTASWMGVVMRILSRTGEHTTLQMQLKSITDNKTRSVNLNLTDWRMNNLKPDPLESLGLRPYEPEIPMIIGQITPNSPAARTSLLYTGDKIISLDSKPVTNWITLVTLIDQRPQQEVKLGIERRGKIKIITITTDYRRDYRFRKHGFLGIAPDFQWPETFLRTNQYNPATAALRAWQNIYDFTHLNLMIIGKIFTGKASLQSLGGPVAIFQSAGTALNQGIAPFLSFLAFLSVSIGIINILPIPGLDGGHLLFQTIEAIIGRPVSSKILALCYRLGIIALVLLVIQTMINDILRL